MIVGLKRVNAVTHNLVNLLVAKLDYIIFLEKATYDRITKVIPWDAPQILEDFGRKDNFEEATDDLELAECYKAFIERVRVWVEKTFADPENLKTMVI